MPSVTMKVFTNGGKYYRRVANSTICKSEECTIINFQSKYKVKWLKPYKLKLKII